MRKRRKQWARWSLTVGFALAITGAVVAIMEAGKFHPPDPSPVAAKDATAMTTAAPTQVVSQAPASVSVSEKIQESLPGPAQPEPSYEDVTLEPPFRVVDGRSFSAGQWLIAVKDIIGLPRDAVCIDRNEELFACGLQARAALANLLASGDVRCTVRLPPVLGRFESDCTAAATHLGEGLVRRGWAQPRSDDAQLAQAMLTAQTAQAGLWNGGWRIRTKP